MIVTLKYRKKTYRRRSAAHAKAPHIEPTLKKAAALAEITVKKMRDKYGADSRESDYMSEVMNMSHAVYELTMAFHQFMG